MQILASIPVAILSLTVAGQAAGELHAFVQDSRAQHEFQMDLRDGAEAADTTGGPGEILSAPDSESACWLIHRETVAGRSPRRRNILEVEIHRIEQFQE